MFGDFRPLFHHRIFEFSLNFKKTFVTCFSNTTGGIGVNTQPFQGNSYIGTNGSQ